MYIENPKYRGCNNKPDEALPACLSRSFARVLAWIQKRERARMYYRIKGDLCIVYSELANEIAFTALFDLPTSNFRIEAEKVFERMDLPT